MRNNEGSDEKIILFFFFTSFFFSTETWTSLLAEIGRLVFERKEQTQKQQTNKNTTTY